MFGKTTYLDNSAGTRLDERVLEAQKPYLFETYAVPTSEFGYSLGIEAKEALDKARAIIARTLNADPEEISFTSGGTESSNAALIGVARALSEKKGRHIIVSKIEDFPVLHTAKALKKDGFDITYLEVDGTGLVDPVSVRDSIRDDTIMVSVQHANQEIGTVQDISEIGRICREKGVAFHTDATHTFARLPLDVKDIGTDLVTLSAHTIHGPKGIGALYIRKGTPFVKSVYGGFQEFDRRAGFIDVSGAVGFAKAVELIDEEEIRGLRAMRDRLISRILAEVPDTTLNGHPDKRLPQNANITFHFVEGESITLHLDMRGFAVSTGSACFSKSLEASHVILGIGGDHERAHGSIRFTFSRFNRTGDVDRVVEAVKEVVGELRRLSPLSMGG